MKRNQPIPRDKKRPKGLAGIPNIWKIILVLTAVVLGYATLLVSSARADSLTIACYKDWRPYSYVNAQGKPEGVLIDFWRLWGEKNHVSLTFIPGYITQSLARVRNGEADIMIGVFRSKERAVTLDFSAPITDVRTNIYIRQDMDIDDISEIPDTISVGVIKDDFVISHFDTHFPNVKIKPFPGSEAVVNAALAGRINAYALDFPNAVFLLAEHDALTRFKILEPLYTQKLRAAVIKGNTPLLSMINKGMKSVSKEDIKRLYNKWGIAQPPLIVRYKTWIITAIAILLGGCLGFGVYIYRLKSRMRRMGMGRQPFHPDEWRQMIDQGENDWVEFKSSLRWNIKTEKADKRIEAVILKTLSAFMNARGGTLFIGINDDGEAVGIEADYKTFQKKPDRDGFMLKLSGMISQNLGNQSHKYITTDIQSMDECDVCRITVKPGERPVYIKEQGKESFYIRAGAASVPLSMSEAHEYISTRW